MRKRKLQELVQVIRALETTSEGTTLNAPPLPNPTLLIQNTMAKKMQVGAALPELRPAHDVLSCGLTAVHEANDSLLHSRVRQGNVDEVRWLIVGGAKIDAINNRGETPLHYAAGHAHAEIVTLLLENGANPLLAAQDGMTPLEVLCSVFRYTSFEKSLACMQHFLRVHPALQNFVNKDRLPLFYLVVKEGCSVGFLRSCQELIPLPYHENHFQLMDFAVNNFFNSDSFAGYRATLEIIDYLSNQGVRISSSLREVFFTFFTECSNKQFNRELADGDIIHLLANFLEEVEGIARTPNSLPQWQICENLSALFQRIVQQSSFFSHHPAHI